jgi:hypothetical protein
LIYLLEPEKGWETLDSELLGNLLLLGGIDLTEWKRWGLLSKHLSSSGVLWSKFFAVSTIVEKCVKVLFRKGWLKHEVAYLFTDTKHCVGILTTMERRTLLEC